LDEMQEIRSSTTELARMCAQARANRRWMVSGTPLYTSISDLNGELNFLGVQPFCLSDSTDGFWGRRIQAPWQVKDESALDLLNVLLDGVMMRHSKSQKTLSGQSILELPSVQLYSGPVVHNNRKLDAPKMHKHNGCPVRRRLQSMRHLKSRESLAMKLAHNIVALKAARV